MADRLKDKFHDEKMGCLARTLLKWSLDDRRMFLWRAERRHGFEATEKLRHHLKTEWLKKKWNERKNARTHCTPAKTCSRETHEKNIVRLRNVIKFPDTRRKTPPREP